MIQYHRMNVLVCIFECVYHIALYHIKSIQIIILIQILSCMFEVFSHTFAAHLMDYPSHSISPSTICEAFTNHPPSFAPHTTSLPYRSLGAPVISYAMPLAVGRHNAPLFSMLKNHPMLKQSRSNSLEKLPN